jgi:hypothetical protein
MKHYAGQLGFTPPNWTSSGFPELPIRLDILWKFYLENWEDDKAVFSIHGDTLPHTWQIQKFNFL